MGLSFSFERATPFALSLSKLCLFLFLWVEAAQPEPYIVFSARHGVPFIPGLGVVFRNDILSQGIRETSSKEVQGAFLIQSISGFGSQGLKPGNIRIEIYALHADTVQFCRRVLLFGRVHKGLIEFSDEMSPIDWIGGGDLDVVNIGVCGGALLVDPIVLDIDPIIDYIAFEKAKGKEGFLHRVIYHVASFIKSEVYV